MKEATGDMTMTIVVIVGVIAVLGIGKYIWDNVLKQRIIDDVDKINEDLRQAPEYHPAVKEYYNM